jgi:hypothetical protein
MKMVLGTLGDFFREKRSSTLKVTKLAYQFEKLEFALVDITMNSAGKGQSSKPQQLHDRCSAVIKRTLVVPKGARLTNISRFPCGNI